MVDIPDRWQNLTWQQLRGHASEMVEDMRVAGSYIGLGVPALPQVIDSFLRVFQCQRCGHCCQFRTSPGIALSPEDVMRLSSHLNLSRKKFKETATFTSEGLRFLPGPCRFYDEKKGCSVHVARPTACRLYPINMPVRAPTGAYMLAVDSPCPEGRRVAVLILEWQAAVALGEVPKPEGDAVKVWEQAKKWQDKNVRVTGVKS